MNKPLFDICIITKNEEKTLPRLLYSLKEYQECGGIVNVLDTGSTDNTVQCAKDLGCIVQESHPLQYLHIITEDEANNINNKFLEPKEPPETGMEYPIVGPCQGYFNFSEARNSVAKMSTQDWILTIDGDEVFLSLDIQKINQAILENNCYQFEYDYVHFRNHLGHEHIKFTRKAFYNHTYCHWERIIHEMLVPHGNTLEEIRKDIPIKYLDESILKVDHIQNKETDRASYLPGLAIECHYNPLAQDQSHHFAREMWWNGRPWSGAKEFKRHITLPGVDDFKKMESMLFLCDIYGAMNHPKEQLEWIHQAQMIQPNRREPLIKFAQVYSRRREWIPCNYYGTAATQIPWDSSYGVAPGFYDNELNEILYMARGWIGDTDGARNYLMKCINYTQLVPSYIDTTHYYDIDHPIYTRDTQYYFEYANPGIEGWMTYEELLFLYETAKKMDSIIELGSWKGRSTHALCSSRCPSVIAIDHWKGSGEDAHEIAKVSDILQDFKKNVGHFENLTIINRDINDIVDNVPDGAADMVFIDAGHTYEEVKNDIRKWKSKATKVLCGHDYSNRHPGVIEAVNEELGGYSRHTGMRLGGPDEIHGSIWVKWL